MPYMDGEYFGNIFTTLHHEAKQRNSMLFTIQALSSVENPTAFDYRIGTDVADGWLLTINPQSVLPSSSRFLNALAASGKPVVTIGYEEQSINCQSVIIDNRSAIKEAVLHLIRDHGHRRIAFVGAQEHIDLLERFEGYKEALLESGIPIEEELHYQVINSLQGGGETAAEEMLERGIDFTAVVAATDMNAMGIISRLQAAGYHVPEHIAVIGFDDLPSSATFTPPLTTVHQPIADISRISFDLLHRQITGETIAPGITHVRTSFIARSSCGCPHQVKEMPVEIMRQKLKQSEENVAFLTQSHNQLSANWVSAARAEYFDFSKMFTGISHWGCLAMWDPNEDDHRHLIVKQVFSEHGDTAPPLELKVPIEQFPPVEWLPAISDDEFIRIQAIRSDREDLGFIVLIGPIDKLILVSEVDVTRISCNISVTALVRDQLYNQVRSIAEQLEIVSRTTNDGIWAWDMMTNQIQWSTHVDDVFSSIGETLTQDPESFFRLVHPEDEQRLRIQMRKHIDEDSPLKTEFRILSPTTGQQLWLYIAGDSMRDQHGKKTRMIGSLTNITEKKLAEKQIMHLAFHDVLTGLPNRQFIRDLFETSQISADRHQHKMGFMLIDLDRFKIINDTLGHQVGDQLLQVIANNLQDVVQSSAPLSQVNQANNATVARHGGDEFIVLLNEIKDTYELQYVADQIIARFQEPFAVGELELFTTASIGISVYPDDGQDLDAIFRCADFAMYYAKDNGKNRSKIYSNNINSVSFATLSMENKLRRALERNEFELYYQPQIDLEHNEIYGVEALIRWHTADHGLLPPSEFISLAEDSGLIIPIGKWVLREACIQKKKWIDQGLQPSIVSVNISAIQLQQSDFVDMVMEVLEETQLSPEYLCLEVVESTTILNLSNSMDKLHKLSKLGIHIAIDDFGTGYSSLSMLKHLPITNVKIDRSFVNNMISHPEDAAIASAIISIARQLGFIVIAEGVETESQLGLLMREKCHCIQGYIISKPLTAEDCLQFMKEYRSRKL